MLTPHLLVADIGFVRCILQTYLYVSSTHVIGFCLAQHITRVSFHLFLTSNDCQLTVELINMDIIMDTKDISNGIRAVKQVCC